MRKGLVFGVYLGSLASGLTQAQVLNTADQPQVMGAEGSNSPTLQLPPNPPSGGSAEVGNGQGGSAIQGIESPAAIKLNPQTPILVPNKTQGPQAVSKSIKKDTIRLDTKKLEGGPGLKGGGPKVDSKGLNIPRSKGSLLGSGMGGSPGLPSGPGTTQPPAITGFGAKPGAQVGGPNPGPGGSAATKAKSQNWPKLPGQSAPGATSPPGKKKSLGFGSSLAKMGNLPPLNLGSDEDDTTGTAVGNTNDGPTPAKDGTDPTTGLPPLIEEDSVDTSSVHQDFTSTDPKDKKDVEAMKGIFKNTGNPNDPGDGSVEVDQEKITAVKKAIQKRKCAGSDTRTTGSENCVQEVPTQAKTQQRVCKKRSEIGGRCEQWGPVPTGPIVDYNKAQPDNVRPD